jgi:hypothetical protein
MIIGDLAVFADHLGELFRERFFHFLRPREHADMNEWHKASLFAFSSSTGLAAMNSSAASLYFPIQNVEKI